jgi:hypothetical protein
LIDDLKDGVRLIALLEVLANTKLVSKFIHFIFSYLLFILFFQIWALKKGAK